MIDKAKVFNYALRHLRSKQLADDAVSYAYRFAFEHPDKIRFAACYAVRRVQRDIRSETRRKQREAKVYTVAKRQTYLETMICDLSPELRETARYLASGCTQCDIAELMGVSQPTIAKRVERLRMALA